MLSQDSNFPALQFSERGAYTKSPFEGESEQASLALVFYCFGATMSGVTEILLLVAIILGILILPRALRRPQEDDIHQVNQGMRLTGWQRLAIIVSVLWLALLALFLKPWHSDWLIYLSVAVCPVGVAWGVYWIFSGFRRR